MDKLCPVCTKPGEKTCGACKSVSYCSIEHQRQNWKAHEFFCTPFLIQDSGIPLLGKQMVAARKIKAGSLVLAEAPTFSSPEWTEETLDGIPNCLTCGLYMIDKEIQQRRCKTCHWPVCSEACEKMELHAANECRLFHENQVKFPPAQDVCPGKFVSGVLTMIRGVGLKSKDEALFNEIMDLQQSADYGLMKRILSEGCELFIEALEKLIGGKDKLNHPIEEYKKMWRIARLNEFTGPFTFDHSGSDIPAQKLKTDSFCSRKTSRVYLKASRINHSCSPNLSWSLTSFPTSQILVRAIVDIKKGQPLTFSYGDERRGAKGTFDRQREMRQACGFICKCERCLDNTELGTFMSAVTCQACRDKAEQQQLQEQKQPRKKNEEYDPSQYGYFLTDDTLDVENPDATLSCNRCGVKAQALSIHSFVHDLEEKFQSMEAPKNEEEEEPTSSLDYEFFIKKYEHKAVHRNHWILQLARDALLRKYHEDCEPNELTRQCLNRCVSLRLILLEQYKVTSPGLCSQNVRAWYKLSEDLEALLEVYSSEMDEEEKRASAKLCQRALNISWDFYEKIQKVDLESGAQIINGQILEKRREEFLQNYKSILE